MAVEREAMSQELSCYDLDIPEIVVDGHRYRQVLRAPDVYQTASGEVRVTRSLYRAQAGDKTICPLELRAGLIEGRWTPSAAEQAAFTVAHLPPRHAAQLFDRIGNMRPSPSSLDRLPKAISRVWEEHRLSFEAALWAEPRAQQAWLQAWVVLHTGIRATEARRLTSEWIEPAPLAVTSALPEITGLLRLTEAGTKSRKERITGLTRPVHEALLALSAQRGAGVPLLPSVHRRAFVTACQRIGYPTTITLRDLRHCYGTYSAQGTGDLAGTQAALGHSDPRVTQRYLSSTQIRTAAASAAVARALDGHRSRTQEPRNENGPSAMMPMRPMNLMVGVRGFEPPTSCSRSRHANQAALHPEGEAS